MQGRKFLGMVHVHMMAMQSSCSRVWLNLAVVEARNDPAM